MSNETSRFTAEKKSLSFAGYLSILLNLGIAAVYLFYVQKNVNWQFGIGDVIVFGTLATLLIISLYAIWLNGTLFANIKQQIEQIQQNSTDAKIYQNVQQKYAKLKQNDGLVNVNIPSFLEEFMGEYEIQARFVRQRNRGIPKSLKLIQMFISMAILIGVLGTFIGLIIALGEMGKPNSEVLNGINTAFYTSVAGILNSLLINVSTRILNTDQLFVQLILNLENLLYSSNKLTSEGEIIKALQQVADNVTDLKESFVDMVTFSKELRQGASSLNQFNTDFGKHAASLKTTVSNVETVTNIFNQRTNTLHMDMEKMLTYIMKSQDNQVQVNTATTQLSETVSGIMQNYEALSTHQINILAMTDQNLRETENQLIGSVKEIQYQSQSHQATVHQELQQLQQSISVQMEQQVSLAQANREQLSVVEVLTYNMQDILDNSHFSDLQNVTKLFSDSLHSTVDTISTISNAMKQIELQQSTQVETMNGLAIIFNDVAQKIISNTDEMKAFVKHALQNSTNDAEDRKELKTAAENFFTVIKQQDKRNYEQFEQLKELFNKQLNQENEQLLTKLNSSINELSRFLEVSNKNMDNTLQSSIKGFKEYIELTNSLISNKLNSLLDNQFMLENIGHIQLQKIMQDLDKLTSSQSNS